jgi:hypothetical protein
VITDTTPTVEYAVYDARVRRGLHAVIALIAAVVIGGGAVTARAEPGRDRVTVALLPLDAEAKLALYGQPVAAELSRALAADGLDVAVVGQGDPVPTRAVLVVDGTIAKQGKGIALKLRVRDPARAEILAEVAAAAPTRTAIDKAAATAASELVPKVRALLAARAAAAADAAKPPTPSGTGAETRTDPPTKPAAPAAPAAPTVLLVATSRVNLDGRPDAMIAAIAPAFERLIGAVHHRPIPPAAPVAPDAPALASAARTAGAALAISIDVLALELDRGAVPSGRARARIRIVSPSGDRVFDRVVRTDTVVGGKGELAAHVAAYAGAQLAEIVRTRVAAAVGGAR